MGLSSACNAVFCLVGVRRNRQSAPKCFSPIHVNNKTCRLLPKKVAILVYRCVTNCREINQANRLIRVNRRQNRATFPIADVLETSAGGEGDKEMEERQGCRACVGRMLIEMTSYAF